MIKTFLSKNKNHNSSNFDDLCRNPDDYKGQFLGSGSFGYAYKFKDIKKLFPNSKKIVIKDIPSKRNDKVECAENFDITIGEKEGKPRTLKNVFYCEGRELVLSEFYLSLEASKLNSENFIDTYVFKDCSDTDSRSKNQYIIMEKIDATFIKIAYNMFEESENLERLKDHPDTSEKDALNYKIEILTILRKFDSMVIQILHALWCLHRVGINHNDCKGDNIFCISKENYRTKDNKKLTDYDYVEYDFITKKIYIPVKDIDYIIKIGDFGLSQKFSEPAILTSVIFNPWAQDYLSPFYDLMLAFSIINEYTSFLYKSIQVELLGLSEEVDFINDEFDAQKFRRKWVREICPRCNNECPVVKKMDEAVKKATDEELKTIFEDEFDFICNFISKNKKDQGKNRRQDYNFLMSEMKNSNLTVDKIINSSYFNTYLEKLNKDGWYSVQSVRSIPALNIISFGGPGYKSLGEQSSSPVSSSTSSSESSSSSSSDTEVVETQFKISL